jgi:hypothetical protein
MQTETPEPLSSLVAPAAPAVIVATPEVVEIEKPEPVTIHVVGTLEDVAASFKRKRNAVVVERVFTLRADTNAIRAFEREGFKLEDLSRSMALAVGMRTALLYALLRKHHGTEFVTVDAVGDLMDAHVAAGGSLVDIINALISSMKKSQFWIEEKVVEDPEGKGQK